MIVRENIGGGDLRGYGALRGVRFGSLFCSDLNDALNVMQVALSNAQAAGVSDSDTNYQLAQQFYTTQTGLFTKDYIDVGGACAQLVSQCKTLVDNLNTSIAAAGGTQVPTTTILPPAGVFGSDGMPGWMIGIIAVVGVLGGAWLISSVSKIYVTAKKTKAALPAVTG